MKKVSFWFWRARARVDDKLDEPKNIISPLFFDRSQIELISGACGPDQARALEVGFEYVTTKESLAYFRKRK